MSSKQTGFVHARIQKELKEQGVRVLSMLGLSVSEFIKLSFAQIVRDKSVQFELSLLAGDTPEEYTKVKDMSHLKKIISYKGNK